MIITTITNWFLVSCFCWLFYHNRGGLQQQKSCPLRVVPALSHAMNLPSFPILLICGWTLAEDREIIVNIRTRGRIRPLPSLMIPSVVITQRDRDPVRGLRVMSQVSEWQQITTTVIKSHMEKLTVLWAQGGQRPTLHSRSPTSSTAIQGDRKSFVRKDPFPPRTHFRIDSNSIFLHCLPVQTITEVLIMEAIVMEQWATHFPYPLLASDTFRQMLLCTLTSLRRLLREEDQTLLQGQSTLGSPWPLVIIINSNTCLVIKMRIENVFLPVLLTSIDLPEVNQEMRIS